MNATAPAKAPQFSTITEQPGQPASRDQLAMLAARYAWAAAYAAGRDVLEVACGAGLGLGALAQVARIVEAGDLDEANLSAARRAYFCDKRINLRALDAMRLPYRDESFDLVLLFEALYYLPSAVKFFHEAQRVLRPGGRLLIATVNREWSGFNPSPFHTHYLSASELRWSLEESGYTVELQVGFPEPPSAFSSAIGGLRRAAVALNLVPRTMRGKALLKRLFYGRLNPVPARIELQPSPNRDREGAGSPSPQNTLHSLAALDASTDLTRYRVLYAAARKDFS